MPIYEYRCNRCHKEFSYLHLHSWEGSRVSCKFCGNREMKRLLSSFTVHQTEESRLANLDASRPRGEDFYKDSRNIGLVAKKRMRQLGADLGRKMDEIVERGRTGKILDDYQE